ncbi:hypothetical protein GCM10023259_021300 [Thermocatellispora tengchongensis]
MPAKAAALASASANTVRRTDSPPARLAATCTAVATGPYTEGVFTHSSTAPATGSAGSIAGVVAYGSWPSAPIRPYAA